MRLIAGLNFSWWSRRNNFIYMRFFFLSTLISLLFVTIAFGSTVNLFEMDREPGPILENREVLCTVSFAPSSVDLSEADMEKLASVSDQLKGIDRPSKIIRVEGFSSPEGEWIKNYRLSFARARVVCRFLQFEQGIKSAPYIAGFGPVQGTNYPENNMRMVQIVVYDNMWTEFETQEVVAGGR